MEKALEKQVIKSPKLPKKSKIGKFNLAMIAITIISLGLIIYAVMNYIGHPNTYEELEPMMEEAQAFDMRASELSGQYVGIEDQIGEEAYFNTMEEGYEDAIVVQRRMVDEINDTNAKIQAAGGITTYEELQRVRIPAGDKYIENELAEYYESEGFAPKQDAVNTQAQVSTLEQPVDLN